MSITRVDIEHIRKLARLDLTEEEAASLHADLEKILEYMEVLKEVDLEGVEPMVHSVSLLAQLHEDEPREGLSAEEALSNAPEHLEGFFTVPTVVELTLREGSREEG